MRNNRRESVMMVTLVTFSKSGVRKELPLENASTVIGRKPDADLRIPLAEISRSHCEVSLSESGATLRDLDSSNGTFVNGEQITERPLKPGDLVKIGPVTFVVQIDGRPETISPAMLAPRPAKQRGALADAATKTTDPGDTDDIDIDALDELNMDDLSDLDMDEINGLGETDDLEEVDDLEELSEDDLIED
jgi:pSer/pThr/pTyr-binding forkhead associated (FHA) protein